MKLERSYDPTVLKINLGIDSGIKPVHKLIKSLTETSNKVHEPKTYNKIIDNSIYRNRYHEHTDK